MIEKTMPIYNTLRNVNMRFKKHVPIKSLSVECSSICNSKCTVCPRSYMNRDMKTMGMELFRIIVRRCLDEGIKQVSLGGFGEPLIDPEFKEKVKCLIENNLQPFGLTTNASLLNDEMAETLLKFQTVAFSINGLTKETYEKINYGMNKEKIYNNVKKFLDIRDKPNIVLNYTIYEDNYFEKDQFLSYWQKKLRKGDKIAFLYAHNWGNKVYLNPAPDAIKSKQRCACGRLWGTHAYISVDGNYTLCCMDFNIIVNLGNVKDLSINGAWYGKNMQQIRKWHIEGKFDKIEPCQWCSWNYLVKQEYKVIEI